MSIVRIYLKKGCQEVVPRGKRAGWKGVINDAPLRGDLVYPAGKQDLVRFEGLSHCKDFSGYGKSRTDGTKDNNRGNRVKKQQYKMQACICRQ